MFLLRRLTSRSSRSIAVMIAFAQSGGGGARGGRMGSPDDERGFHALPPLLPLLQFSRNTPKNHATT
ncbi:MAG TPA: hypothetical protein VEL04_07055 [Burkholderiales bacterium]|nr:hypothetical protein [Burkholderiales bacterium]